MLPNDVKCWPPSWRERLEERAAIKEFDGGMDRAEAERQAEKELRAEEFKSELSKLRGGLVRHQRGKTFASATGNSFE